MRGRDSTELELTIQPLPRDKTSGKECGSVWLRRVKKGRVQENVDCIEDILEALGSHARL
jgi:hypothetical protein